MVVADEEARTKDSLLISGVKIREKGLDPLSSEQLKMSLANRVLGRLGECRIYARVGEWQ